ncbi:16S rRNA (cytosine(1402)-N(4))-methyltransferase, partial [Brucella canis]
MMASLGGDNSQAEGAEVRHVPVLIAEVIDALKPAPGAVIVDGTFGAGGYTRRILETGADVIAIDRDPTAIEAGRAMEK